MDADAVRTEVADVVIIATGSYPRMDGVQAAAPSVKVEGIDLPHVCSTHEVLTASHPTAGKTALVLDDVGHLEAIAAVDTLMARGFAVTLATRHAMMTPYSTQRTTPAMERFNRGDFTLMTLPCSKRSVQAKAWCGR